VKRVYSNPEGFMHWCTECGACLEAKSRRGILVKMDRHYPKCPKLFARSDFYDVKTLDPINRDTGRPFRPVKRRAG